MATLFKEVNYNLQTLIQQIDMGTIGLPDIQRPFVWKDIKVRELFDSMYKGYPVGYFLFWANAFQENNKNIGTTSKQKASSLLIVDGQQRLTSLFAVLKGVYVIRENYIKEQIVISFKPLEEKFEIPDAATKRSPEYFQNISVLWEEDADIFQIVEDYIERLNESRPLSQDDKKKIRTNINKLKNLESYPFSVLELDASIDEEQVADVFVRINSQGKKLNMADFILTLMSVFWDDGRKELEEFCRQCRVYEKGNATAFNYILEPKPDQMLRVSVGLGFHRARLQYVYSILRGKDLETGNFSNDRRDQQFEILQEAQKIALDVLNWHEFIKAINIAGYVKNDYISSGNNVLYCYVMFLIGKTQFHVPLHELKKTIAKWFFMTSLTGRYTGSPETQMEMDLARLREVTNSEEFITVLENIISNTFTDDYWNLTLPTDGLATSSASSPALYAYYASLYILDSKGLFSQSKISDLLKEGVRSKKAALERHHLFPKNYLKKSGITEQRDINQIANYALVEWNDNIAISDSPPHEYLHKYLERFEVIDIEKMYYTHGLYNKWEESDYYDFLKERRKKIALVIKKAFSKL